MDMLNVWHGRISAAANFLGAILIVLVMLLIVADVGGRAFLGVPLFGVPEIVKMAVVAIAWLQMAYTLRIGAHLRTTIIIERMPPAVARASDLVASLMGALMFGLIVYSAWPQMAEAWRIGEFEGDYPVRVPTAPVHTILILGAVLTAIQFLLAFAECAGLTRKERG